MALQGEDIVLREWQKQLVEKLVPSAVKVIWVVGTQGGEGKSFLKNYLFKKLGELKCKIDVELTYPLVSFTDEYDNTDHFIFDIPTGFNPSIIRYETFEEIKYGAYCNKMECGFLKVPNVLLVLAPYFPRPGGLSKERWEIYNIENNKLVEIYNKK